MSKDVKRLFTIDLEVYEKAMSDLNLYHDMLIQAYHEAVRAKIEEEFTDDLRMQADIIQEILIKLRTSIVNGADYNPGGTPIIH